MTAGVALRVLCLISSYVTYVPSFPCRENVFAQMHPNADSGTGNRRMEKKLRKSLAAVSVFGCELFARNIACSLGRQY